jgi:undecaprenyl-phosphate 4-deoxy-4-formamido-L-arabinose transferase
VSAGEARPALSVVVPFYNEESTIDELLARVTATLRARGERFELVLVDDGSSDRTGERLAAAAAADPRIHVYTLSRNFGQAAALCCGIFAARGDVVVTMDGDLQNPPEEIPRLLDALGPGVDLVTASRAVRHETTWRWIGSRAVHRIARFLVGIDIGDFGGQFKVYRREVIEATRTAWAPGKPFFALAAWLGFRVCEVSVRHDPRRTGRSRYGILSLVRLNADVITSFTTLPLAALALLSVLSGAAGGLGVIACLATGATAGFGAALSLLLLGLSGVFFATAALGIYLARVYRTVAGAPAGYVLRAPEAAEPRVRAVEDRGASGSGA